MLVQPHPVLSAMRNKAGITERAHQQVSELQVMCGAHLVYVAFSIGALHFVRHHSPSVLRHSQHVLYAPSKALWAEESSGASYIHTKTGCNHCHHARTHICHTHITRPLRPTP